MSWTRRAKATASAGLPDSRSGVCCKGAGEMLGSVEALPSLSRKRPGHCLLDTRPPSLPSQGPDTRRHVGFLKALS